MKFYWKDQRGKNYSSLGTLRSALEKEINFFDFATYFQERGCKNALYLDGFVSRAYIPSKNWKQLDGNFGVIIGVTEPK